MKRHLFLFLFFLISFFQCKPTPTSVNPISPVIEEPIRDFDKIRGDSVLDFMVEQYKKMIPTVPNNLLPRNTKPDGKARFVKPQDWTSGFYPGILWYLYEHTNDEQFKTEALKRTGLIESQKFNDSTHDLGFMLYCSFGNGFRISNVEGYQEILLTGAETLVGRFNEIVGCIKSWDWAAQWQFPVIVDNMMNLEYLFWAAKMTGDSSYFHKAVSHANITISNHYRPDFSSFHVLDYDILTGDVLEKTTLQGYADESVWARGQAWGLYGFTLMYRETKDKKYLNHAQNIAAFLFAHPNMPDDFVPYWDFSVPDIPNAPRDASAAAIMASALLELQQYVDEKTGEEYLAKAEKILQTLSSEKYRANLGENNNFILKHSVGNLPSDSEIDTPIIYADYYFVEALLRYLK